MEPYVPSNRFPLLRFDSENTTASESRDKAVAYQSHTLKKPKNEDANAHEPHPLQPQRTHMKYIPSSKRNMNMRRTKIINSNGSMISTTRIGPIRPNQSNVGPDVYDELRELPPLLEQWSLELQDAQFTSIPLLCQLWDKWLQCNTPAMNLAPSSKTNLPKRDPDFLHQLRDELHAAVYMPLAADEPRLPYFTAYRRLCQNTQSVLTDIVRRENVLEAKQKLPFLVERAFVHKERQAHQLELRFLFRSWKQTSKTTKELLNLKVRCFQMSRERDLRDCFTGWRVECLRSAYQRESQDHQTMISINASTSSKKEAHIKEQDVTIASMSKLIENLTASNAELTQRVDTTTSTFEPVNGYNSDFYTNVSKFFAVPASVESVEVVEVKRDIVDVEEKTVERLNQMLLESLFIMARVVESCSIQLLKDTMESLESQLDGCIFQKLSYVYHEKQTKSHQSSSPSNKHNSIKKLAQLPADEFLLCWFQMQLTESSISERASDRVIKNFTTDLCDGRRYALLLHQLFPTWFTADMVQELDTDERVKSIANFHTMIQPTLPAMVTCDSIHAASAAENVAFVGMLFGISISSIGKISLEKQRHSFLNIATSWQRVRGLLLHLKRVKDSYDPLTTVNLLKELRNCEARCKQIHAELCTISSDSNVAAGVYSVMAYRILGMTWNCMHARSTKTSIEIVDERLQEQLSPYAIVSSTTIRELLADEEGTKGSEEDSRAAELVQDRLVSSCVTELENALAGYARELHDIFHHYSTSSDGSIASLSLAEFSKFVEDCKMYDDRFPSSLTGKIYTNAQRAFSGPLKSNHSVQMRELGCSEFVDTLLQLSCLKLPHMSSMIDRFHTFMDKIVLPNAVRSQSVSFRADIASPKMHAVYQKYKVGLQQIFRYYVSMAHLREQCSTMGYNEFMTFAKDCKILGAFVPEAVLKQLMVNAQRLEVDDSDFNVQLVQADQKNEHLSLTFENFQEVIAALTCYMMCSPYIPFYLRMERFITEILLPRAKQKKQTRGEKAFAAM